ncbi:glutamine amidotransferase [Methanocalculus chunghsingensis]|uniref:Glutamine--fructose-6-phosphate aminotransferase [isomerizing] n=1 Tax=Methanocalculus chunghsingensis TaxID=156457 RepID=A0A8J8B7T1_9EURY|nr:glutamine--fructose-6-phosphate transaminase (isomerizing) [Methanocalculus chunghsingensis]MBR1370002.1 glutamine amidotransferase [Methanocalculus chunghsingensis]
MCGIVGYIGRRPAQAIVTEGLKRLEYRGYDSFGVATLDTVITITKKSGRISDAGGSLAGLKGSIGIGHTRWATHGEPNDRNAHPHLDCAERIAVVHNGIIENYAELRRELTERGHTFRSETDTEVIAHLVEERYDGDLLATLEEIIPLLSGSFAILLLAEGEDRIVAARMASPLVIGIGDRELLAASDVTPLIENTRRVIYLEDGDSVELTRNGYRIRNGGMPVEREITEVDWDIEDARLGGFPHYMQKEIFEQPQVFYNTLQAVRESPDALDLLRGRDRLTIVACGSSYHAGLLYKYLLEMYCGVAVLVEQGSEFKYYPPPLSGTVIGISQSGETADTLAALKMAQSRGCKTVAVTNVVGSTITRMTDATIHLRAGPEMSVAATKSFIAQLAAGLGITDALTDGSHAEENTRINVRIEEILTIPITEAVGLCSSASSLFYIGRGLFYPAALEGALKMKEISYIHAEGYAAGELKHGPFALLSGETPVIAIAIPGAAYPVMLSNIKEIKARGAPVIAIGLAGDIELAELADIFIELPKAPESTAVATVSVLLQRLAYETADSLGRDIDKPRNLAKSVTVE